MREEPDVALSMDAEVLEEISALLGVSAEQPPLAVGDWRGRRDPVNALLASLADAHPAPDGVSWSEHEATGADGAKVPLRWYVPAGSQPGTAPGPAVLYVHGGGMILGSVEIYHSIIASYVDAAGVPALAVDYRLAPEHPHPTPVEDCYAALAWMVRHAGELCIDPSRTAVMGDSAGGGLAAALALLARERGGPALARQILIYPMLDDRTTVPDPLIAPFATWTYEDNITGWGALLGERAGGPDVPPTAAPARSSDLSGLPPAYIEVGDLDIFRAEDVEYAARLAAAGVPAELHVHAGAPHGFDAFASGSSLAQRAVAERIRVLRSL